LWSLPGGHIEPGETASAAAVREVREETGVEAELAGLVDVHDVILRRDDGALLAHYLIAVYCGRWLAGEPMPGGDEIAARFAPGRSGRRPVHERLPVAADPALLSSPPDRCGAR
jgi:ADP-ribose pyrophosphatase YjhB (NUDIX family)